jgi:hypothetical protein
MSNAIVNDAYLVSADASQRIISREMENRVAVNTVSWQLSWRGPVRGSLYLEGRIVNEGWELLKDWLVMSLDGTPLNGHRMIFAPPSVNFFQFLRFRF